MTHEGRGWMSDLLERAEPVSAEAFGREGVTIRLASPVARYSLRAREAASLEAVLGVAVPAKIGEIVGDIICLGPDEWLLRKPAGSVIPMGEGLPLSICDVSERAVCFIVEGSRAAEVLMAGCPLDLDRWPVGRGTRTIFETVEIVVLRLAEERFEVEVWRSFAPWLMAALEAAAE